MKGVVLVAKEKVEYSTDIAVVKPGPG